MIGKVKFLKETAKENQNKRKKQAKTG